MKVLIFAKDENMCFFKGQRKSGNYDHQSQVKLSPKPLSNPDTDLNPNWEAHEYH